MPSFIVPLSYNLWEAATSAASHITEKEGSPIAPLSEVTHPTYGQVASLKPIYWNRRVELIFRFCLDLQNGRHSISPNPLSFLTPALFSNNTSAKQAFQRVRPGNNGVSQWGRLPLGTPWGTSCTPLISDSCLGFCWGGGWVLNIFTDWNLMTPTLCWK